MMHPRSSLATVDDFLTLDLRVGTVVAAESHSAAPASRPSPSSVDFGALGRARSSAQITDLYEPSDLVGLQVIAVVNLPPRRVAGLRLGGAGPGRRERQGRERAAHPGAAGARRRAR